MSRLTKGMFGSEFNNSSKLFGLSCGQMSSPDLVHNGGWYNAKGEKLGWGDLGPKDFRRLSRELEDGELFIVLGESDSFWNFVHRNPGTIGAHCETVPTVEAPGTSYVAEKCFLIFAKERAYYVDRYGSYAGKTHMEYRNDTMCEVLTPDAAATLIAAANA